MIQLITCTRCKGFLALALRACPHCGAPLDRTRQAILGLAGLAGGGAVSMTLMACYGPACVDENDARCKNTPYDAGADALIDAHVDGNIKGGDAAADGGIGDAAVDVASDASDAGGDAIADAADGG